MPLVTYWNVKYGMRNLKNANRMHCFITGTSLSITVINKYYRVSPGWRICPLNTYLHGVNFKVDIITMAYI